MKTKARKFKQFRKHLGQKQSEFAATMGYNRQATISEKESCIEPVTTQDEIIIDLLSKKENNMNNTETNHIITAITGKNHGTAYKYNGIKYNSIKEAVSELELNGWIVVIYTGFKSPKPKVLHSSKYNN